MMVMLTMFQQDIIGIPQAEQPPRARSIQAMNRHILNGIMLKARQAAKGSAVARSSDPRIQLLLRNKYPPPILPEPRLDQQAIEDVNAQLIDRTHTYIEDADNPGPKAWSIRMPERFI